jgi:DNA-binding MurR/RpiR family transcriptional regulator
LVQPGALRSSQGAVRLTGIRAVDHALAVNYGRLSRTQRRVIDHLLRDARYAAVVSGPELAKALGVSESTVTRAAQALGFAGYPDLQAHLREVFVSGVTKRVAAALADLGDAPVDAGVRVMLEDAESIRQTAEDLDAKDLDAAITILLAARSVYLFGSRGSFGLALMLGMGLRLLLPDVRIMQQTAGDLADQLIPLAQQDALVAVSLRRTDRIAVDVARQARRSGARVLVITDHRSSVITRLADISLVVRSSALRLTASYAAASSVVNALITVTSLRQHAKGMVNLERAEQLWRDFVTYEDHA